MKDLSKIYNKIISYPVPFTTFTAGSEVSVKIKEGLVEAYNLGQVELLDQFKILVVEYTRLKKIYADKVIDKSKKDKEVLDEDYKVAMRIVEMKILALVINLSKE